MTRTATAFAIAPLWVPLLAAPVFRFYVWPDPAQVHWVAIGTIISATFAYVGCVVLGLPLFRWLIARGLVSFWIAPFAGFVIGVVTWLLFMACFALMLGEGAQGVALALADAPKHLRFLLLPAGVGALVGATIWLIARPDRQIKQRADVRECCAQREVRE
jgi:hypothetical protein